MFRILLIIAILFTTNMSWALEWNICHKELESLRKMSRTESSASNLTAASNLAVKLSDLYDDIQTQRFEYDRCKNSRDGTLYCLDTQRRMNTLISDYQTERSNFSNLIISSGKYSQAKEEACGFKLN